MIYVSGAPGNVGTELVRRLSDRGEKLRALVHRPQDADLLRFPGVETVLGDLADPESLRDTLSGADRVFLNSSVGPAIFAQKNLIDAARQAGVRKIVKVSWIGASEDSFVRSFGRWHAETERALRDSGVAYTILRANNFMQNHLTQITMVTANTIWGTSASSRTSLVDARDVAAVAATALTEPGHAGKTYEVTGPQSLSKSDMADIISRVTGRRVVCVKLSAETMAEAYQHAGWPEGWVDELVAADEFQAEGHLERVTEVVEKVGRTKPVTFEEFVREFAAAAADRG
jgi:uncharacterized protein YbjT (DUF2867 family)